METRHTFYIGVNGTIALKAIDSVLVWEYGISGYTITPTRGVWQGEVEDSLKLEIIGTLHLPVESIAQRLATALGEDAIYLTTEVLDSAALVKAKE